MFNRGEYSENVSNNMFDSVLSAAGCHVHKSWGVHAAVTSPPGWKIGVLA